MKGWLIGILAGPLGTLALWIIVGWMAATVIAGGWSAFRGWQLHQQIASLEDDLESKTLEVGRVTLERGQLQLEIDDQNRAVAQLQQHCETKRADAAERAGRTLLRERTRPIIEGTGPPVMNQWLSELYSSPSR